MSAVAAGSLLGTVAGHAIVGPSATDKEEEAEAKEAEGHQKAVKELQCEVDDAKTKANADRVVTK